MICFVTISQFKGRDWASIPREYGFDPVFWRLSKIIIPFLNSNEIVLYYNIVYMDLKVLLQRNLCL